MMRTQAQFEAAIKLVEWYLGYHKQPVWLVPTQHGYKVVWVAPHPDDLPAGTAAIQYGPGLTELSCTRSTKEDPHAVPRTPV